MASVTMKAIANDRYGPPEHLRFEDRAIPEVEPDSVLLRVRAASIRATPRPQGFPRACLRDRSNGRRRSRGDR